MAGQDLYQPAKMAPALKHGYQRLDWVRKSYGKMTREYAGRHYGSDGDGKKRPVNLIAQFVHTVMPNLLNQRPTHVGRTWIAALQGEATLIAIAADLLWEDMNMVDRVHSIILDALLCPFGVAKIGLRSGPDVVKVAERGIMLGQPYVARVSPDDYVADPAARSVEELCWQGHRYRVPKAYALESGIYDPAAIEKLTPIGKGEPGKPRSGVEEMSGQADADRFKAQEYIELWDVAIRNEDEWLIGTMGGLGADVEPAWVNADGEPYSWDGDAAGPYELLSFYRMPDNFAGISPGMTWLDLHEATDKLYNKMIRQALRAKQTFAYNRAAADDALTIKEAADGDAIAVDNVDSMTTLQTGGVMSDAYPFIDSLMAMWNNSAGNMQLLGGGDIQSDKATGQSILQANANTRLRYMKDRVWRFSNAISRHLTGYLITDPLIQLPLPYRIAGGEVIDVVYDAQTRRGDKAQMVFEIEQQSMVGRDPEVALKRKVEALTVLQNMLPLAQTGLINVVNLARQLGRETGWKDMDEIVNDPMMGQQALMMGAIGVPPQAGLPGAGPMGQPAAPGAMPAPDTGGGMPGNMAAGVRNVGAAA